MEKLNMTITDLEEGLAETAADLYIRGLVIDQRKEEAKAEPGKVNKLEQQKKLLEEYKLYLRKSKKDQIKEKDTLKEIINFYIKESSSNADIERELRLTGILVGDLKDAEESEMGEEVEDALRDSIQIAIDRMTNHYTNLIETRTRIIVLYGWKQYLELLEKRK